MVENGWALYAHPFFLTRLVEIVKAVRKLIENDPAGFHHHQDFKFFEAIVHNIKVNVPANPAHPSFRQGSTLGRKYQHWFRVKRHSLPNRYRLFFQFMSRAPKTIIYAWINDETCIRRDGDRRDVYEVFKAMLASGKMPNSYDDLLAVCGALQVPPLAASEDRDA